MLKPINKQHRVDSERYGSAQAKVCGVQHKTAKSENQNSLCVRERRRDAELRTDEDELLRRSGVSKHRQPPTPRRDKWRQPATHTHLCLTACAPACVRAYASQGRAATLMCAYTSVYKYTMGALCDRHAPAMRNIQNRSRARRKDKVTDRAQD